MKLAMAWCASIGVAACGTAGAAPTQTGAVFQAGETTTL